MCNYNVIEVACVAMVKKSLNAFKCSIETSNADGIDLEYGQMALKVFSIFKKAIVNKK